MSSKLIVNFNGISFDINEQKAQVLFFVLDNETRSTAAMIEVAHALGRGQKLVLVINKYSWPGTRIAGEEITHKYDAVASLLTASLQLMMNSLFTVNVKILRTVNCTWRI